MIPHKVEKRRSGIFAVVHPDTGEELGQMWKRGDEWMIGMPRGSTLVVLPERFDTRHAARMYILSCHEPEAE